MRVLRILLGAFSIFFGFIGLLTAIGIIISEKDIKIVGIVMAILMLLLLYYGIKQIRGTKQPHAVSYTVRNIHTPLHPAHDHDADLDDYQELEREIIREVASAFDGNKTDTKSWSNTSVMQWSSTSGEPMPEEMKRFLSEFNLNFQMPGTRNPETKSGNKTEAVRKPVSMDCPGCGAKLPIDLKENMTCEYCGTEVTYKKG